MISVIGNKSVMNFFNLNKNISTVIFDSVPFKKDISLFFIQSADDFQSLKTNKAYSKSAEDIKIYFVSKKNQKNIHQKYLSNTIFYPIRPHKFLNLIRFICFTHILKKYGLTLDNNNLGDLQKNIQINLTNTELKILNILILGTKIERKVLEKEALNFKNEITSNSLDSHLVRLRKKVKQLNNKIEIISKESKYINLIISTWALDRPWKKNPFQILD